MDYPTKSGYYWCECYNISNQVNERVVLEVIMRCGRDIPEATPPSGIHSFLVTNDKYFRRWGPRISDWDPDNENESKQIH